MNRFLLSKSLIPIKKKSPLSLNLPRIPKFNNETLPEVVVLKIGGEVATDHVDDLRRQVSSFSHITQFLNFSKFLNFVAYMSLCSATVSYEGGGMRFHVVLTISRS